MVVMAAATWAVWAVWADIDPFTSDKKFTRGWKKFQPRFFVSNIRISSNFKWGHPRKS
jgi:hypothetical protein